MKRTLISVNVNGCESEGEKIIYIGNTDIQYSNRFVPVDHDPRLGDNRKRVYSKELIVKLH